MKIKGLVFDLAGVRQEVITKLPHSTIHVFKDDFLDFGEPMLFESSKSHPLLLRKTLISTAMRENLTYIDSDFLRMLQAIASETSKPRKQKLHDLVEWLKKKDPMQYSQTHLQPFYEYKLKRFLAFTAFGFLRKNLSIACYHRAYTIVLWSTKPTCFVIYDSEGFIRYLMERVSFHFIPKVITRNKVTCDVVELKLTFRQNAIKQANSEC